MRRTDKRSSSKYIFLGVLFIATMVVTFLSMGLETVTPSATTMTEATLPVISMLTDEGTEFNPLHGYTAAINQALTNDSLTPIAQNRKLDIVIYSYGADVQEVSYKVRSLSDNSLIENTKVNTLNRDDNKITATLGIKNLIDDNVQYALEIMIKTSAHDEIYYYTRIVTGENYELDKKFEFVKYFNACTLNPGRLNEIQKYLETLSSGNNSNYGKVNINSSLSQVGWGEITPYIESQLVPKVKEISKDVAIITLNYRAGAVNEYDSYDSYNVYEYYRIRQTNSGFYLLNYEREANQIFDGKNDLTSAGKINLGIQSSSTAEYASDEKARYAYYVNEGSLWCFNTDDNIYTRVFSFNTDETDGIRENYNEHGIKILNVQDSGDCSFLVYGYMNRGTHEGEVGTGVYHYDGLAHTIDEEAFIPSKTSYEVLKAEMGKMLYLNEKNEFYLMMDDSLYRINLGSMSVKKVVEGLSTGSYCASESNRYFAWVDSGNQYSSNTIKVKDLKSGKTFEVKKGDDQYLRPLGFIGEDFIYG